MNTGDIEIIAVDFVIKLQPEKNLDQHIEDSLSTAIYSFE